jgi:mRNA-degrading endonuclease toxin of MazEF toxin-antitoxin module
MPKPSAPLPPNPPLVVAPPAVPPPAVNPTLTTTSPTVVAKRANPQRGDVYWVNIPRKHTVGSEQYKRRPFLVVSNNGIHSQQIVIGVPLSFQTQKKNRQYRIAVLQTDIILDVGSTLDPGERIALTEQVRCLSVERLEPDRQAKLTDTAIYAVEAGLAFVMDIR